jgi:hypothetical protein
MPRPTNGRLAVVARVSIATVASLAWAVVAAAAVLAASPSPAAGGDPRSSGQGPGLVGDPAFAVLAVLAIGLATFAITFAYIRLTGGRRA